MSDTVDIEIDFNGRVETVTLKPKLSFADLEALCLAKFGIVKAPGDAVDIVVVDD